MTPGERRRRDRKWNREEHAIPTRQEYRDVTDDWLKGQPHPSSYFSHLNAYHYVTWLIDNGHSNKLGDYLTNARARIRSASVEA